MAHPNKESHKIYNELYYKWNGILAIEIFVTHKVEDFKKYDLEKKEIPIIEVEIKKKYRINENANQAEIYAYKSMITNMFKKKIFGKLISDPSNKEYKKMVNYKEAIKKFEDKIISLENETIRKQEFVDILSKDIDNLNIKKFDLENRIEDMQNKEIKLLEYQSMKRKLVEYENVIKQNNEKLEQYEEEKIGKKGFLSLFKRK
ncbi:hypothetical protein [Carnobacterium divergens]|uniref:hypothetical protein n=1 Tax=Carnobacterium divergens TaxID=2748 RepID=UPI0007F4B451|nr:hypothetical protein [Carnobacterium divergens]SBO17632.1 hypothetical protein CDIV41_320193 [Carnobacterium divergens]